MCQRRGHGSAAPRWHHRERPDSRIATLSVHAALGIEQLEIEQFSAQPVPAGFRHDITSEHGRHVQHTTEATRLGQVRVPLVQRIQYLTYEIAAFTASV